MTDARPIRILSAEEIASRDAGQTAHLRWPELASLYSDRSIRLRELAAGHPMRDYLLLMADLASAQQQAAAVARTLELPTQQALGDAARNGVAPLAPGLWTRRADWRDELVAICDALLARSAQQQPGPVRDTLQALRAAVHDDPQAIERQADRLLAGISVGLDMAAAPIIGAALQVHYARLVAQTHAAHSELAFGQVDDAGSCPCCGSRPTASVVRLGGDAPTRYLHCSLCATEWHLVRITCAHCGSSKSITYQELEPEDGSVVDATVPIGRGAVRAECCDDCGHYLKIVAMDRDARVEPVADDLASVTLDLLVSEAGQQRHGLNLMLLFGEADEDAQPLAEAGTTG